MDVDAGQSQNRSGYCPDLRSERGVEAGLPRLDRWLFLSLLLVNPAVWGMTSAVSILWTPLNHAMTAALFATQSGDGLFELFASVIFLLYIYHASRVVHDDYWSAVRLRNELEARGRLLEHMSSTDALTQVSNRIHFDSQGRS